METEFEGVSPDIMEQELAGESAMRRLFAVTRRRFRELQREEGLSQQDLAQRMELKPAQISKWFANPSNMTVRTAAKLLMAMGRKLELGMSDPFALVESGGRETEQAGERNSATVLQFSRPEARQPAQMPVAAAKRRLAMAARTSGTSGQPPPFEAQTAAEIDRVEAIEIERVESEAGSVIFWAWRSIVLVQLPSGQDARSLRLGESSFDILPAGKGLHFVGGLTLADAAIFAEGHRGDSVRHSVGWR